MHYVTIFPFLVSCQSFPQLHRPDRVSVHVALLLSAHLLWRNAHHRQCDHSQRDGCYWQNCRQGVHTRLQLIHQEKTKIYSVLFLQVH